VGLLGKWPMPLVGGVSVITSAARSGPRLSMLAVYAATGRVDFISQPRLLARRRRRLANPVDPVVNAS
jgi:hypothetical protein